MGLKFMQRAEAHKKEQLKDQAKMLIEQIKEEQEILDSGDDEGNKKGKFVSAAEKFSKKALAVPIDQVVPEDIVRKAALNLNTKSEEKTSSAENVQSATQKLNELKSSMKKSSE